MNNLHKRRIYPTRSQKVRLICLLEQHKDLKQGKFTSSFTKEIAASRWKAIAEDLNRFPGAKKTWCEWKKCWQDMKAKNKKKRLQMKSGQVASAGHQAPPPSQDEEENLLESLRKPLFTDSCNGEEKQVKFDDITTNNCNIVIEMGGTTEGSEKSMSPTPVKQGRAPAKDDKNKKDAKRCHTMLLSCKTETEDPLSPSFLNHYRLETTNLDENAKNLDTECSECANYGKNDRRNEIFAQLLAEEFKYIQPCARTKCYVQILKFLQKGKGRHINDSQSSESD